MVRQAIEDVEGLFQVPAVIGCSDICPQETETICYPGPHCLLSTRTVPLKFLYDHFGHEKAQTALADELT